MLCTLLFAYPLRHLPGMHTRGERSLDPNSQLETMQHLDGCVQFILLDLVILTFPWCAFTLASWNPPG